MSKRAYPAVLALVLVMLASCSNQPIGLHPENPHYFLFRGEPTILVTSAEHYGAVVNRDFDYAAYLDALQSYGLNYTRIYPGYLFEPDGKFIKDNSLGLTNERIIVPWARSDQPGYALGGNKFDLDRWDPEYFLRLTDFIQKAGDRGIVVEICFFNAQYNDTWPICPLFHKNNIQGVGNCDFKDAQTLRFSDLVRREDEYVKKIVREVNGFDNVILEVCDEPFLTGTPIELAGPWIEHMVGVIRETESELPQRHLIAQQMEGPTDGPCDFTNDARVGLIVAQYVWEADAQQMGGMKALELEYGHLKPIELNETNYYPVWYKGDKIAASRAEAWEFIVGGGAGFNHLNGLYTIKNPTGKSVDNAEICEGLRSLMQFMRNLEFLRMKADRAFVTGGLRKGVSWRAISEPGRQYALYLHHSTGGKGGVYTAVPGDYVEKPEINLPAGSYRVEWVEPATGKVIGTERIEHAGGRRTLVTPRHRFDIALRAKRL